MVCDHEYELWLYHNWINIEAAMIHAEFQKAFEACNKLHDRIYFRPRHERCVLLLYINLYMWNARKCNICCGVKCFLGFRLETTYNKHGFHALWSRTKIRWYQWLYLLCKSLMGNQFHELLLINSNVKIFHYLIPYHNTEFREKLFSRKKEN